MTTFLDNHSKIQQIESRLNKNQYLSNECLPNFIDAQMFKALKASNQVPKRQTYPNFYHWYILMRQFAQRTLDYWLKNDSVGHYNDQTILEVIKLIQSKHNQRQAIKKTLITKKSIQSTNYSQNTENLSLEQKKKLIDSLQSLKRQNQLIKVSSQIDKKLQHNNNLVTEYLMSIKLSSDMNVGVENIKRFFCIQNVQVQSIRILKESSDLGIEFYVRVNFQTSQQICQELKNIILRCSNVQTIQCKKQKRNKSR